MRHHPLSPLETFPLLCRVQNTGCGSRTPAAAPKHYLRDELLISRFPPSPPFLSFLLFEFWWIWICWRSCYCFLLGWWYAPGSRYCITACSLVFNISVLLKCYMPILPFSLLLSFNFRLSDLYNAYCSIAYIYIYHIIYTYVQKYIGRLGDDQRSTRTD